VAFLPSLLAKPLISLFSLIKLTVIYGYVAETRTGLRVLLVLIAVSILANAMRIAVTRLVVQYRGVVGAQGTPNLFFGYGSSFWIFFLHRLSWTFLSGDHTPVEQEEYA